LPLTKNVAVVPAGKVHLKGHPIPAYQVTGKTHFRGKVAVALLTRACGIALVKDVAIHNVGDLLFVTIGGLTGADVVVLILLAPGDAWDLFTQCKAIQVKKHMK
jgi:hypothetical protein